MEWVTDFSETWQHPAMRHALLVHWPIILAAAAVVFSLLLLIKQGKSRVLRFITLSTLLALTLTAFMAKQSGGNAEDNVKGELSAQAKHVLEEHEELGDKVWFFAAITCVLSLGAFAGNKSLRMGGCVLALVGSLFTANWVNNTAHHGGELVYEHGVGTPGLAVEVPPPDNAVAILQVACWRCHGGERPKGGLNQTTMAELLKGGKSGHPAIVPGKPQESELIARLRSSDEEVRMPPKGPLPEEKIKLIEKWIADGAVWPENLPELPQPREGNRGAPG